MDVVNFDKVMKELNASQKKIHLRKTNSDGWNMLYYKESNPNDVLHVRIALLYQKIYSPKTIIRFEELFTNCIHDSYPLILSYLMSINMVHSLCIPTF
jgi:hypothetical protein